MFCAASICGLLENWEGIDTDSMSEFIVSCTAFDGALGIVPGSESQGGATYCGIAALVTSGRLQKVLPASAQEKVEHWLVSRQVGGFQGRCNKEPDACYAFWNGATLALLNKRSFVNDESCRTFLLNCQSSYGGFSKFPKGFPDLLHSYYALSWLSISGETSLSSFQLPLQIPLM